MSILSNSAAKVDVTWVNMTASELVQALTRRAAVDPLRRQRCWVGQVDTKASHTYGMHYTKIGWNNKDDIPGREVKAALEETALL